MTKNQIKYLKLLGYSESDEEGAILRHKGIVDPISTFVWAGEAFESVLGNYYTLVVQSERKRIASKILNT